MLPPRLVKYSGDNLYNSVFKEKDEIAIRLQIF